MAITRISIKGPIISNDIGWVYHYLGWDCCCPDDVRKGLEEAAGGDVILDINSPGGYCDVGSEIYTMLMEYEGNVEAHIMSAASAASVVACGADRVLASDTMVYMIHNSRGGNCGDYRDMLSEAEALQKYNESIINAYVRKTGKSREELQGMMDRTTWMSAADAIRQGFVDDYLFGDPEEAGARAGEESRGETGDESPMASMDGATGRAGGTDALLAMNGAAVPIITPEKALEIRTALGLAGQAGGIVVKEDGMERRADGNGEQAQGNGEQVPGNTEQAQGSVRQAQGNMECAGQQIAIRDDGSDRATENLAENDGQGGEHIMTLEEFLKENPEARAAHEALLAQAGSEGAKEENARLKELDQISASVTPEDLREAKYGEKPVDAKTLAYQALVKDGERAGSYMQHAIQDARDAKVDEVGSNASDPDEPKDESDAMAAVANAKIAGRR
ncbi:MAG: hypothetical protein HFH62_04590 [Lachnospiraceae bacterium]|nr:hypothetical protein [Lachnospiraceae bacterium]